MKIQTQNTGKISRRTFVKRAAAGVAPFFIVPRHVLGGPGYIAPSDRLNVAVIGTGLQGIRNIKSLLRFDDVQVPAICDVSDFNQYPSKFRGSVSGRGPAIEAIKEWYSLYRTEPYKGCREFIDFRNMFREENKFDAVLVATPDHTHATASMWAIKHGKHVYCEKPMSHSVWEARKLTAEAQKAKVATQMGIQGHSGEGIRAVVEWIRDGSIGPVKQVHAWTDAGGTWSDFTQRPRQTPPVPQGLNWDLWLGPKPKRPYHPAYHPYGWKAWWDFGTGAIGDRGCHHLDPAFWALDLNHPDSVEGRSGVFTDETTPKASLIYFNFPARGSMPPVQVTWYDGGLRPPRPEELETGRDLGNDGILFVGEKGKILCGGWGQSPRLIPEAEMKAYKRPAKTLPRVGDHHRDWIDACKNGGRSCADFSYSGPMTEVLLLGLVAVRRQKLLQWDPVEMKVINDPQSQQYIKTKYQNGWVL